MLALNFFLGLGMDAGPERLFLRRRRLGFLLPSLSFVLFAHNSFLNSHLFYVKTIGDKLWVPGVIPRH
jgi:hypothetical protein